MDAETIRWIIGTGVIGLLSFVLGGGWPAKTYRKWSDAQLFGRLDGRYVPQVLYDADKRENALRHDQKDELMSMLRDSQRATNSLTAAVERASEGVKYAIGELQELKADFEEWKRTHVREG